MYRWNVLFAILLFVTVISIAFSSYGYDNIQYAYEIDAIYEHYASYTVVEIEQGPKISPYDNIVTFEDGTKDYINLHCKHEDCIVVTIK